MQTAPVGRAKGSDPPIADIQSETLPDCDAVRSKGRAGGAPERASARPDALAAIAAPYPGRDRAPSFLGLSRWTLKPKPKPRCSPKNSSRASFSSTASGAPRGVEALRSGGLCGRYWLSGADALRGLCLGSAKDLRRRNLPAPGTRATSSPCSPTSAHQVGVFPRQRPPGARVAGSARYNP
jgi:hypothetical protein